MSASEFRRRLHAARHGKLSKLAGAAWVYVDEERREAAEQGRKYTTDDAAASLADTLSNQVDELPFPKPTTDELRGLAALALPHVDRSVLEEFAEALPLDVLVQAFAAALPKLKREALESLVESAASALPKKAREELWFLAPEVAADYTDDIEVFARIEAQSRMGR